MSISRDQRLKMICAAGDKIVNETGVNPSEVTGYAVSMAAFGRKPNGDFYILFEQWLKLRRAVPGAPPVDMPAEAAAELEEWSDHLKAQIMQRVTGIVRSVAGSFEQTTGLRVVALERLCADQSRRNQEVLGTLVDTEAELETARAHIAALTDKLQSEHDEVQRLVGRLQERGVLQTEPPDPAVTPTDALRLDMAAAVDALINGPPEDAAHAADSGDETGASMAAESTGDAIGRKDQHPVIEADCPTDGQVEMPLVTNDAAHEADVGGHGPG